ncbi:hypothetical protein A9W98_20020 [Mycobacterium gordonae]|uniref:Aldehyde dehydrogenase domain-containing protein n=1 Tax=Mycobacterium gordonae TaxID=1778 RepID=A0A1A6BGK4_MYCGO|nr:hypothetical protein A9W98_20020 [Mycobacterium gordonae]
MALLADGASALFIDGKFSRGAAGTFPTANPATEEVLGVAADADANDMGRAIEAARRAFDDTDWSRDTELRVRCIRQLREAMQKHTEELRELTIAEVGAPRMLTSMAQILVPDIAFGGLRRERQVVDRTLELGHRGEHPRRTHLRDGELA